MRLSLLFISAIAALSSATAQQRIVSFETLSEGQNVNGFRAAAVYLNDAGRPMGARLIHQRSGFTLDLLEIQSVPQAFIWVNSFPTSNMGEPHTQEHLLLGKGNKGRAVASLQPMALANSSAYTMQWRTCYFFNTSAGADVFYDQFERRMDALLHPDYTDEEVRREVRNFGISESPRDHALRLEEKGTVYNEMVSSMDEPNRRVYSAANQMIYGPEHPLAFNAGGTPEALRAIRPEHIRLFHQHNYHLANMGVVASVPKDMTAASVLRQMDAILNRIQPQRPNQPVTGEDNLPAPQPARSGEIRFVEYPNKNEQNPGTLMFAWPAERTMDIAEQTLLDLFLSNVGGGPATNLYKRFVDSKTREMDFGAKNVFAAARDDQGHPIMVSFSDVPVSHMTEREIGHIREKVMEEFNRIAAWKDGSPEVAEFNARLRSRVVELRRTLAKFVNSPPGFGARNTNSWWMMQLYELGRTPGFRKSVTLRPELEFVDKQVAGDRNIWREYLAKWKMTETQPFALAAKPNPALSLKEQQERDARAAAETARLKEKYGVTDDQEAIRRYRAEYDTGTAELEKLAAQVAPPKFVDKPPMTLDDQLEFKQTKVGQGIPLVASTFDSMTSATTGIALRLNVVPRGQLVYLSMLPALLTQVGVIENGRPVSFEAMTERIRNEILSLNAAFNTDHRTGRAELVVRGAGNDASESRKALEWIGLVLLHPDWRAENLPRIRDLVDQTLSGLRTRMQTREESWVQAVEQAYWRQDSPLLLATESFLTQAHNVFRLRWMLKDCGASETCSAAAKFLGELAQVHGTRAELKRLLAGLQTGEGSAPESFAQLSDATKKVVADAARDLDLKLSDLPDSSLPADWTYLCNQMSHDLSVTPRKALAALDDLRRLLLKSENARMFLIGAASTQQKLAPGIQELAGKLDGPPAKRVNYDASKLIAPEQLIAARVQQRQPDAKPVYVGLLNANSQGGVFLHSAPGITYQETDRDKLLNYLASNLYSGPGAHSMFMKTWGAGLAYSNGIRLSLRDGRLGYYAERTPELPQTLRFVVGELKRAGKPDAALVEYAIAGAFAGTRAANGYEARGEAMAADLADGLEPAVVARFHKAILDLRHTSDLAGELHRRMNAVYGAVLPGLSVKTSALPGTVYLVIGPEKQLAAWEDYLKTVEGPETKLYRLYPRDFWIVN